MSVWIMSIVGVICLGILLEIMLPDGKTAKYVKGAFSLLVVFVIAAPLPNMLKKDWTLDLSGVNFGVDEEYISSTYAAYTDGLARTLERKLLEEGYVANVDIELKDTAPAALDKVNVAVLNFKEEVLPNITDDVIDIVSDVLKCDKKYISVQSDRQ